MAEDTLTNAGRIDLLRQILSELNRELETSEEWRALRQLDEREKNGSPLEGIDGVLFRGRLVRRLAESSRTWRAVVHIEEAIVDLEGPERLEVGMVPSPAEPPIAAPATKAKLDLVRAADPAPRPDEPSKAVEPAATAAAVTDIAATPLRESRSASVPDVATPANSGPAPIPIDRILDIPERLRVKIRAFSQALPEPGAPLPARTVPLPQPADRRLSERLPGDKPGDAAVVASLQLHPQVPPASPLVTDANPELTGLSNVIDQKSPRSVLQRIRLISAISPQPALANSTHLAKIAQPVEAAPPAFVLPGQQPAVVEAGASGPPAAKPAAVVALADQSVVDAVLASTGLPNINGARLALDADHTPAMQSVLREGAIAADGHELSGAEVVANQPEQRRLAALESELEQLIDRSAAWTHPLDAARQARTDNRNDQHLDPRSPAVSRAASSNAHGDWVGDIRSVEHRALRNPDSQPSPKGMLEPETSIDLDVDEAEVTITVSTDPISTTAKEPAPARLAVPPISPARRSMAAANGNREPSPGHDDAGSLNSGDYAGYHLDLEEAAVEIIVAAVPPEPTGQGLRGQDHSIQHKRLPGA